MKNCIILTIIGSVFITCMVLILTNDNTAINCTKCNKVSIVYGISDEEKTNYVCPICRSSDENDVDENDENDVDKNGKNNTGNHYTSPTKGTLHRHMGGTGGLW